MKIGDLKDLLLYHCNTTKTMPITFVSDCSIENCTVAPEKDHSVKHEQTECVPVTFVHESMINLVKTQDTNKDEFD